MNNQHAVSTTKTVSNIRVKLIALGVTQASQNGWAKVWSNLVWYYDRLIVVCGCVCCMSKCVCVCWGGSVIRTASTMVLGAVFFFFLILTSSLHFLLFFFFHFFLPHFFHTFPFHFFFSLFWSLFFVFLSYIFFPKSGWAITTQWQLHDSRVQMITIVKITPKIINRRQ